MATKASRRGETTLVRMELAEVSYEDPDEEKAIRPDVKLELPAGLRLDAGPVFVPSLKELTWRIAAEEWGDYELVFDVGGESLTKTLQVSEGVIARRSTMRPSSFLDQLLYPAEPPLPGSTGVTKIELAYPYGNAGIEGWESELTWLLVFLVLSIVAAFALRKPLGVTI